MQVAKRKFILNKEMLPPKLGLPFHGYRAKRQNEVKDQKKELLLAACKENTGNPSPNSVSLNSKIGEFLS